MMTQAERTKQIIEAHDKLTLDNLAERGLTRPVLLQQLRSVGLDERSLADLYLLTKIGHQQEAMQLDVNEEGELVREALRQRCLATTTPDSGIPDFGAKRILSRREGD